MRGEPSRKRAEERAYRILARRAHSERELREKLKAGGFSEPLVNEVIEKCGELGYLNDENFARQRARDLAVNRLAGDRRIAFDLRERGISEELSRQAIEEARAEISEKEAIDRIIGRAAEDEAIAGMDDRERTRLARRLLGKGFPTGLILRRLKKAGEEEVHDDDGE